MTTAKRPFTLEEVLESAHLSGRLPTAKFVLNFIRDLTRHAVPLVEGAVRTFSGAGEDALTNILLLPLYMLYSGATRETDRNGHVDIALKQLPFSHIAMTGEAKVIGGKGFPWYAAGLTKLVSKYNAGRDEVALMVGSCRKPSMYALIDRFSKEGQQGAHGILHTQFWTSPTSVSTDCAPSLSPSISRQVDRSVSSTFG